MCYNYDVHGLVSIITNSDEYALVFYFMNSDTIMLFFVYDQCEGLCNICVYVGLEYELSWLTNVTMIDWGDISICVSSVSW